MAAAQIQGQLTSIESVITGIMVDPVIAFLRALDDDIMPMRDIALANGLIEAQLVATKASTSIKWTEGEKGMTDLTLTTAIAADTTTEFDFSNGTEIQAVVPNMVINFGTENVLVVSVDTTAKTCEVTRGYDGTTALTTIADNTVGKVLGVASGDLQVAGTGTASFGAEYTNYLHLIEEVVDTTDVASAAPTDTGENDLAYQIILKFAKMGRQFGNALWRSVATGTTAANRVMNGFRAQVSTNSTAVSGAVKFSHLDTIVQSCIDAGIVPDSMFVSPTIKTGLAQWAGGRLTSSTSPARDGVAGGQVSYYESAAGALLKVEVDRAILTTDIFICNSANLHAGFLPVLKSPYMEQVTGLPTRFGIVVQHLYRQGFADKVQCGLGGTCQLAYEEASGLLTACTSVDADGI